MGVLESWSALYSDHAVLRTAVVFAHVGGILGGGGYAVATDRMTLAARREDDTRRTQQLILLRRAHRTVLVGLVCIVGSGLLLLASDLDVFAHSLVFYVKMSLVALLLINGLLMLRAERAAAVDLTAGWPRLVTTSWISLMLWFLIALLGAGLTNV